MEQIKYEEIEAVNQSSLKLFMSSPKDYQYALTNASSVDTTQTKLGSLNHCLLFEPQEYYNKYDISYVEEPSSGSEWKMFWAMMDDEDGRDIVEIYESIYSCKSKSAAVINKEANDKAAKLRKYAEVLESGKGKTFITDEEYNRSWIMVDEFLADEVIHNYFAKGRAQANEVFKEFSIKWKYPTSDLWLKSRIDEVHIFTDKKEVNIFDYKTTSAKTKQGFIWSIKTYGYDIQESFYKEAVKYRLKENGMEGFTINFYFMPQRTTKPYICYDLIKISENDSRNALFRWTDALSRLEGCIESGIYNHFDIDDRGITEVKLNKESIIVEQDDDF